MRFFVTGEQNRQAVMNTIVLLFLMFMLVQWISQALMFFSKMSLSPQSVVDYYLGNESRFTQPRSYQSLLEVSHAHLFSMGMLAVTLTHLLLFSEVAAALKIGFSLVIFISALADEAGGWLVRFVHPGFAWFKIGAFLTLELSLGSLILLVIGGLLHQRATLGKASHRKKRRSPTRTARQEG